MPKGKPVLAFLFRFILIYGILICPWPGWMPWYEEAFRSAANLAFSSQQGDRVVYFEEHRQTQGLASIDTRIVLGNRSLVDGSGNGPAELLGFDVRSICWTPTALTLALIGATPMTWKRRVPAIIAGMILIHVFIWFTLWVYIWNESTKVSLISMTPLWKQFADALEYTVVTQMGISFTVPVVIWILVSFQRTNSSQVAPPLN